MSLYAEYSKEREDKETIETDHGFITYKVFGEVFYIIDLFVSKEKRRTGLGVELADMASAVARGLKCQRLLGSVDPASNGATNSVQALMSYGFEVSPVQDDKKLWWFVKEL